MANNTKPWSSAAAGGGLSGGSPGVPHPLDGGHQQSSSVQQSPFFHREFPKLGGGNLPAESSPQYGPGPSLRPQSESFVALCCSVLLLIYTIIHVSVCVCVCVH
ncbi:hypothetical protein E2C01_081205 [Portunus trituberculatus]|uniref:Uncharacterized protein n=1 Tax=Portunus trituberculatus TaxID=210409 RepID=A0A5B7IP74_PORTR|nr:hypothetical protein [Portunus trituberculatus]